MRHFIGADTAKGLVFQSTHPVRDATRNEWWWGFCMAISIHAPRTGCDAISDLVFVHQGEFQSTHPVRDATRIDVETFSSVDLNFNPRTPYGMRHGRPIRSFFSSEISIHAPRTGCDSMLFGLKTVKMISIHAPRTGCDCCLRLGQIKPFLFQSTHPVRDATANVEDRGNESWISIHAPRTGCDLSLVRRVQPHGKFQSTHPVRDATWRVRQALREWQISIHAPRTGCDYIKLTAKNDTNGFQSTHPVRDATRPTPGLGPLRV